MHLPARSRERPEARSTSRWVRWRRGRREPSLAERVLRRVSGASLCALGCLGSWPGWALDGLRAWEARAAGGCGGSGAAGSCPLKTPTRTPPELPVLPLCSPKAVCTAEGGGPQTPERGRWPQPSPRRPPGKGVLVPLGPPILAHGTFELQKMKPKEKVHGLARGGPRFR